MIRFYKRFRIYLAVLILGVSVGVSLLRCSADEENIGILPNVMLSVSTLDFGQVNVDRFSIRTVTLNNPNNRDVIVERVTSTNGSFRVGGYFVNGELVNLVVPFTIARNSAGIIYIGFYPATEGEYIGKLVIESVDANSRAETDLVDLKGLGLPALD